MGSERPGEDWSQADLDMLLELPYAHIDESRRCHQAGCRLAALVMLAAAMESVLLGLVIAQEESRPGRAGCTCASLPALRSSAAG